MAYATVGQLEGLLTFMPGNASTLLDRASRDIDRALLCSVYNTSDTVIVAALRDATLEQVAWQLESGNTSGIRHGDQSGVPSGGSAGGVSLSHTGRSVGAASAPEWLGSQAWTILQGAGLTGNPPFTYRGG
jgi:hypothetical protein